MIEKLIEECHEHLRESDRKRDQLLMFYTIIIGAYFSSFDKLPDNLQPSFAIAIATFGIVISITAILLRGWHFKYRNTINLLINLKCKHESHSSYTDITKKISKEIGLDDHLTSSNWHKIYFSGVEFFTMNSFLLISFLPIYALISMKWNSLLPKNPYWTIIIDLFIYMLTTNIFSACILYSNLKKSLFADWLLPKGIESCPRINHSLT